VIHLHSPTKSIYNHILPSLHVPDLKVKLAKGIQPSRLSGIHIGLVKQVPQPTVITHQDETPTKKIMSPHIQCMNDSFQLKIMHHILRSSSFNFLESYHTTFRSCIRTPLIPSLQASVHTMNSLSGLAMFKIGSFVRNCFNY